jgi:hypothetical protein
LALFDGLAEDAWGLGFVEVNVGVSTGDDEKVWDLVCVVPEGWRVALWTIVPERVRFTPIIRVILKAIRNFLRSQT